MVVVSSQLTLADQGYLFGFGVTKTCLSPCAVTGEYFNTQAFQAGPYTGVPTRVGGYWLARSGPGVSCKSM